MTDRPHETMIETLREMRDASEREGRSIGNPFVPDDQRKADALTAALTLLEWRPIADAPKDGTWVCGWCPNDVDEGDAAIFPVRVQCGEWFGQDDRDLEPTHFKPLDPGPGVE